MKKKYLRYVIAFVICAVVYLPIVNNTSVSLVWQDSVIKNLAGIGVGYIGIIVIDIYEAIKLKIQIARIKGKS